MAEFPGARILARLVGSLPRGYHDWQNPAIARQKVLASFAVLRYRVDALQTFGTSAAQDNFDDRSS